jgi:3-deoxy-manno-octulosonate cytidylyltransferase (CMP-KDO synthetase)
MNIVAVIPARYGSTRFPGKPLALVKGVTMLQRVWACAMAADGVDKVVIATDDDRIMEAAKAFGGEAVMTAIDIPNGTTRALVAAEHLNPTHIVNVQGDAVLTPPWIIGAVADAMRVDPDVAIATPAVRLTQDAYEQFMEQKQISPASGTTVTFDLKGDALYFSKNVIPYLRKNDGNPPVYRHIGMYGYRLDALQRYVSLPESPLEKVEQLEQLRALENGMPIRVVQTDYKGRTHWSIDAPSDLTAAEKLIEIEGELLPTYDGSYKWKA